MKDKEWQILHGKAILDFLKFLNERTDKFILKGGTALMVGYGLNRFSEDIDLNAVNKFQFFKIVDDFCKKFNYDYRIAKDTDSTKRVFIHYSNNNNPLKIELSLRNKSIKDNQICKIHDIQLYKITYLCNQKLTAYSNRDKIRDLFDLVFIAKKYWSKLNDDTQTTFIDSFGYKGLEHVDYLVETQNDPLIDKEQLVDDFLDVYDTIAKITDDDEEAQNERIKQNKQKQQTKIHR